MIEEILPAEVISAEAFDDAADAYLFPEEQAIIVNAVEARRREFGTVRRCAREALASLGYPPAPLVPGQERAPQWPAGIVGSMTHCTDYRAAGAKGRAPAAGQLVVAATDGTVTGTLIGAAASHGDVAVTAIGVLDRGGRRAGSVVRAPAHKTSMIPANPPASETYCDYRAAAVARSAVVQTVGIDAEPNLPLPSGVVDLVTLPQERRDLAILQGMRCGGEIVHWDRLLFSCKEAIYKAWYPLARRWLGFEDAIVCIDPGAASFTARILVPGPVIDGAELQGFHGRWLARDGLLVTAIAVPA